MPDSPEAQRYRETLVEWGDATHAGEIEKANRLFNLNHGHFKNLRETEAGQTAITALLADNNPFVRSVAATHSLLWLPKVAEAALAALEHDEETPPEVQATPAKRLWNGAQVDSTLIGDRFLRETLLLEA